MSTHIEILIDNSNSMGAKQGDKYLLPDKSTRMSLARKLLIDSIIPMLEYGTTIKIRTFHSTNNQNQPTILVAPSIYAGAADKAAITGVINKIQDPVSTGGTPISSAVRNSFEALSKFNQVDNKIILITDGEETENSNYETVIKECETKYGIKCNVFVIGIGQEASAATKSQKLADITGGKSINLPAANYNLQEFKTAIAPVFRKVLSTSITNRFNTSGGSNTPPPQQVKQTLAPSVQPVPKPVSPPVSNPASAPAIAPHVPVSKPLQQIDGTAVVIGKTNTSTVPILVDDDEAEFGIDENPILNEQVRVASEEFLFGKLKEKYGTRVKWMNENGESNLPYDFEVIDTFDNSIELYIECKGSKNAAPSFLMTIGEWQHFLSKPNKYELFVITKALTEPTIQRIDNILEWMMTGKLLPFSKINRKLKAERIIFTVV